MGVLKAFVKKIERGQLIYVAGERDLTLLSLDLFDNNASCLCLVVQLLGSSLGRADSGFELWDNLFG